MKPFIITTVIILLYSTNNKTIANHTYKGFNIDNLLTPNNFTPTKSCNLLPYIGDFEHMKYDFLSKIDTSIYIIHFFHYNNSIVKKNNGHSNKIISQYSNTQKIPAVLWGKSIVYDNRTIILRNNIYI